VWPNSKKQWDCWFYGVAFDDFQGTYEYEYHSRVVLVEGARYPVRTTYLPVTLL
jgi:hypothetical protein